MPVSVSRLCQFLGENAHGLPKTLINQFIWCRCADDVLVIQELAKLRKQLKAEQKAVDNLFRNKIPTPSTGRGDGDASMNRSGTTPPQEATTAETQRYTTGETWFFCVGKFLIAYLLNLLHALGILPKSSASTASKT